MNNDAKAVRSAAKAVLARFPKGAVRIMKVPTKSPELACEWVSAGSGIYSLEVVPWTLDGLASIATKLEALRPQMRS